MKKFQLLSLMMLMLAVMIPQTASAEYYGIKVAGVSVTSDNCDNITGDDINPSDSFQDYWVRYDPNTKTLTLHNIRIWRTGSNNRAILNESCDGLTIVFEERNALWAKDASPVRLNANTTITSASGMYGYMQEIVGGEEDALTVGNAAKLYINDINLRVLADWWGTHTYRLCGLGIVGDTLFEELSITNAHVYCMGMGGIVHFIKLSVTNCALDIHGPTNECAFWDIKDLVMNGSMIVKGYWDDEAPDVIYYDPDKNTFWDSVKDDCAPSVRIATYIPINSSNFPDENLRNYIVERYDPNNDSRLDFFEMSEGVVVNISDKNIASVQGLEHFRFMISLDCSNNNLTKLNLSHFPELQQLDCWNNQITRIDIPNDSKLVSLECYSNRITYLDFSNCPSIREINISRNNIYGALMTETLESLPSITPGSGTIKVTGQSGSGDNVCTAEQANIAKNKGWEVILGNTDADGNTIYDMVIAGENVTSANYNDLTVLSGVTKNCEDGYARYEPTTQKLYLSGVDIVNEDGIGIHIDCGILDPVIVLGQDPVNITAKEQGIHYYTYLGDKYLTITTESNDWYSEKLNVTSKESDAIYAHGSLQLAGVARIEAKCPSYRDAICTTSNMDGKLYIKENAELRIKANKMTTPLATTDLVLEDDNIIVAPVGAYFSAEDHRLRNAADEYLYNEEVVIGKLRQYNCYVAGTRITNANQHAVLGDTTIVFQEPAYLAGLGTLVLNNANIEAGSEGGIEGTRLRIKLIGENHVSSSTKGIGFGNTYCYIEGPGSLYTTGQYGIDATSKLYISDGAQITAEGSTRYAIDSKETIISGKETIVRMKCSPDARGTFRASTGLTLEDGIMIETPEGAQYVDGEIKDADGNIIKDEWVTIQYTETYDITVAGIGITNHNMDDVLGDGTVSFDPETNTLTLDNANIDTTEDIGLLAKRADLKVNLIGENSIRTSEVPGLLFRKATEDGPVTFLGGGSLNVTSNTIGMQLYIDAVLTDGVQVTVESTSDTYAGLQGRNSGGGLPTITMSGAETVLRAKGGANGSIANFSALVLNDGLTIGLPYGATFVENVGIIADGTLVAGEWVIIASQDYIDGTSNVNANDNLNKGMYNLAGQKVGADYKGIVIVNGRKVLKK